jgi:hypothetical protein
MNRVLMPALFVMVILSGTAFSFEGNWVCKKGDSELKVTGQSADEKKADCEKNEGTWSEKKPAEKKEQSAGGGGGW